MLTRSVPNVLPELANMDRLVDAFFASPGALAQREAPFPALNVWEDEQALHVEAELPGYTMGDLEIATLGNELTIAGSRGEPPLTHPENVQFHRRERRAGGAAGFKRALRIGVPVNTDLVRATLAGGVLTVTLPKAEAAKPRKIEVKAA